MCVPPPSASLTSWLQDLWACGCVAVFARCCVLPALFPDTLLAEVYSFPACTASPASRRTFWHQWSPCCHCTALCAVCRQCSQRGPCQCGYNPHLHSFTIQSQDVLASVSGFVSQCSAVCRPQAVFPDTSLANVYAPTAARRESVAASSPASISPPRRRQAHSRPQIVHAQGFDRYVSAGSRCL